MYTVNGEYLGKLWALNDNDCITMQDVDGEGGCGGGGWRGEEYSGTL